MPKQDRALQIKKDQSNVRKRMNADNKASEKQAEEEEAAAAAAAPVGKPLKKAPATKFEESMKAGKAASAFAKAQMDESDDDVAEEPVAARASPPASAKKDGKKDGKKKAGSFEDEMAAQHQDLLRAQGQRIKARFLRFLVIGYFLDDGAEQGAKPAQQEKKPKKSKGSKGENGQEWSVGSIKDKFGGPFFMFLFVALVFSAKIAGEDFSGSFGEDHVNLYDVIGVPSDIEVMPLRKAYKKLALELHPDKNPDCEECATRFAKISKAYETLNDPERRKAYDSHKSHDAALKTANSVELTDENFEHQVFRSNEVWYVQIYDPLESLCKNFHPAWEEVSLNHEKLAKFGRLDMTKNKQAMALLPQRILMTPVVFRFARGYEPELFQWSWNAEERGGQPLNRFVMEQFPEMPRIESEAALKSWWAAASAEKPKIVITGASKAQSVELMQAARLAHMWAGYLDIAVVDPSIASKGLGNEFGTNYDWILALKGAAVEKHEVLDVDLVAAKLQELITSAMTSQAPSVTVRNHQQLCGANGKRNMCLFIVSDDARLPKALKELQSSKESYAQELLDLKNAELDNADGTESEEEGTKEEALNIQVVRASTSSSRLPWNPISVPGDFYGMWAEAKSSGAFILDMENKKLSTIKSSSLDQLYQGIGYDDVKFRDIMEDFSYARALPDPEASVRTEFNKMLATIPGTVIGYLLVAAALSTFPELELPQLASTVFVAGSILTVTWPLAARKAIMLGWCLTSSSIECQV